MIKNVSDRDYFTNSIHVPVWEKMTPFEKIDIECQLTGYSSAGCITYVELPSTTKNNITALEEIIDYAMSHDIPYFAINVPNDTCMNCGYTDEINDACPVCGSESVRRLRRVTVNSVKLAIALSTSESISLVAIVKHLNVFIEKGLSFGREMRFVLRVNIFCFVDG